MRFVAHLEVLRTQRRAILNATSPGDVSHCPAQTVDLKGPTGASLSGARSTGNLLNMFTQFTLQVPYESLAYWEYLTYTSYTTYLSITFAYFCQAYCPV